MMVSQDGGIPLIGKCLNGNSSDNTVFKERSEQLIEQFKQSETPSYLIADSKLYTEENASNLKKIPFITRIPNNIKLVTETISKAVENPNSWKTLDDGRSMQTFNLEHYGMKQRWQVLSSETSLKRAEKQVEKRVIKEYNRIKPQIFHLQAQRFDSIENAMKTVEKLAKKLKLHQLEETKTIEHKVYKTKGRPKKGQIPNKIQYQILVNLDKDEAKIEKLKAIEAHYIVGSNTDKEALSDTEVVEAYKKPHYVERGFRFLKDPLFFASSLFVKAPRRIMGLLMIMLLSLLVYGIAERRMRNALKEQQQTLPNQINQEVPNPTLRWVFQLLYGINYIKVLKDKTVDYFIEGLTDLRQKILLLFGKYVADIYQIYC